VANAGMTFDTAMSSVAIIAAPASAKAACFTTRMNAASRFEKVNRLLKKAHLLRYASIASLQRMKTWSTE
jgi:hypothetical protein